MSLQGFNQFFPTPMDFGSFNRFRLIAGKSTIPNTRSEKWFELPLLWFVLWSPQELPNQGAFMKKGVISCCLGITYITSYRANILRSSQRKSKPKIFSRVDVTLKVTLSVALVLFFDFLCLSLFDFFLFDIWRLPMVHEQKKQTKMLQGVLPCNLTLNKCSLS